MFVECLTTQGHVLSRDFILASVQEVLVKPIKSTSLTSIFVGKDTKVK